MKFSFFSFTFLILLFISSCSSEKGTNLTGTVSDAANLGIYFDRMGVENNPEILLNTKADASGKFSFNFPEGMEAGVYRLRAGAKSADLILDGKEKSINIDGSLKDFADLTYKVTGAPLTIKYLDIIKQFVAKTIDTKKLGDMGAAENPLIGYMISTKMFRLNPSFMPLHESVSKNLMSQYPDLTVSKSYKAQLAQIKSQLARKQANAKVKVGEPAPEIALPDVKGKIRKLSNMKGKVVLLDFWASWCGPCRKANPHVVEVYKKYKKQGFDVFSVSLDGLDSRTKARFKTDAQIKTQMDRSKERWLGAIKKDNLTWDNHVSDLKKWESVAAAAYGVRSIPKTFLVGRDGNIAAINPRQDLEQQVKALVGK